MTWNHSLEMLEVHCQGELGKVITAGAPDIPGDTLLEQMDYINHTDDSLRRFVTLEPRAGAAMSVNLLVPPLRLGADAGFIVLQADRAHPMSGSNTICVVTALLESGLVPMSEPMTEVTLDTAAGLVKARARCEGGRCTSVSFENVPAWVHGLDVAVNTSRWGTVLTDIAFGGVFYALVDAAQIGIAIEPENARELAEFGLELRREVSEQVEVAHPEIPNLDRVAYVMWRSNDPDGALRTCTTLPPGRVDRSPCGTGSSANLAVQHARGLATVNDSRRSRSIVGGEFTAMIIRETTVAGRPAIVPQITGSAWVYGREELRLDPADPFPAGFALSDTWGPFVRDLVRQVRAD